MKRTQLVAKHEGDAKSVLTKSGTRIRSLGGSSHLIHFERSTDRMPPGRSQGQAFLGIRELRLPHYLLRHRCNRRLGGTPGDSARQHLRQVHLPSPTTDNDKKNDSGGSTTLMFAVSRTNTVYRALQPYRWSLSDKGDVTDSYIAPNPRCSPSAEACPQQPSDGRRTCTGHEETVAAARRLAATTGSPLPHLRHHSMAYACSGRGNIPARRRKKIRANVFITWLGPKIYEEAGMCWQMKM